MFRFYMLYLQLLCVASKFLKLAKWPCLGTGPAAWLQGPVGKFKLTSMSMERFPTATGKPNALLHTGPCRRINRTKVFMQFSRQLALRNAAFWSIATCASAQCLLNCMKVQLTLLSD